MKCSVDGCTHDAHARGWCVTHYGRWMIHGDVLAHIEDGRRREPRKCREEGCDQMVGPGYPAGGHGWCCKHYRRWLRSGDAAGVPAGERRRPGARCGIPGCERKHFGNGWCNSHYQVWRKHGDPLGSGLPPGKHRPELIARYNAATPKVRADLRSAQTMRGLERRRDVEFYLARAETHGRPLTRSERAFVEGVRMSADRERDQAVLAADVSELTNEGLGAEQIGRLLGVSDRTVVRHRAGNKE